MSEKMSRGEYRLAEAKIEVNIDEARILLMDAKKSKERGECARKIEAAARLLSDTFDLNAQLNDVDVAAADEKARAEAAKREAEAPKTKPPTEAREPEPTEG